MSAIDRVIEFLEGGKAGCLWDIIAEATCGDCKPPEDCEGCDGVNINGKVEEQIAQTGLDFMKKQAKEWVKHSVER